MFERHIPPRVTRQEELLDRWLDALNDPTRHAPSAPPEISAIAATARRYHDVLGMPTGWIASQPGTSKDGSMTHSLPSTASPDRPQSIPLPLAGSHRGRMGSLARGLAGAVVMTLLLVLTAGPFVRQYGWPGGSAGLLDKISLFAPGTLTPGDAPLSCPSPGYRPVVEGNIDSDALAAIGIVEAPIQIDGDEIHIPTSSGEVVTLPNTWTQAGGPLWANTVAQNGRTTVRNIETKREWTFPAGTGFFPGVYEAPYVLVPADAGKTDWRIVDTTTGSERLVSDIRGKPFPAQAEISRIGTDPDQRSAPAETSVWLFSTFSPPEAAGEPPELGPNALVLPRAIADAAFMPDTVEATFFHETAYAPATNQIAFATGNGTERAIVVTEPKSGARIVVQDERFTDQALPLTFSDDGSSLIVDQSNAMFLVSLTGDPSVTLVYQADRAFVPIAHDPGSMRVLIMFRDRGTAIVDTASGTTTNVPGVTVPALEYGPSDPLFRSSFNTQLYEVFDGETSTVRYIDLVTGTVSAETAVLNPEADFVDAPLQPEFQYVVDYPQVTWAGSHAFLDENGTLRAVSASEEDSFSIPPPDDFSVDTNQVVDLLVSPGEGCVVLTLREASGVTVVRNGEQINGATTWVAPLEPDATWTRLDVALVGWREVYEPPATALDPATNIASPVATPA